jgi:hypothetical protein
MGRRRRARRRRRNHACWWRRRPGRANGVRHGQALALGIATLDLLGLHALRVVRWARTARRAAGLLMAGRVVERRRRGRVRARRRWRRVRPWRRRSGRVPRPARRWRRSRAVDLSSRDAAACPVTDLELHRLVAGWVVWRAERARGAAPFLEAGVVGPGWALGRLPGATGRAEASQHPPRQSSAGDAFRCEHLFPPPRRPKPYAMIGVAATPTGDERDPRPG